MLQVLTIAERHLALWAAIELGEPVGKLSPALLTYFATTTHHHTSDWTERWAGWPAEFYRACGRLVEALSWMQVREIGGAELALLAGQVRARHDAMGSDEVPTYLRLGAVGAIPRDDGGCALSGYSPNDMLVLPRRLAGALESFDGSRTTAQACADIAGETGVTLDKAAVRRLVDFGILQEMPTLEGSGCSGL